MTTRFPKVKDPRACTMCPRTFERISDLKRHRIADHPKETRRLVCPECAREFNYVGAYRTHVNSHDMAGHAERLWSRIDKNGPIPEYAPELGPCWLWTGQLTKRGYGVIHMHPTTTSSYKLAYELEVGPVPEGLELDHLCRVPACCRPSHLEPVTRLENMRRAHAARKPIQCPHCELAPTSPANLARHMRAKHPSVSDEEEEA